MGYIEIEEFKKIITMIMQIHVENYLSIKRIIKLNEKKAKNIC